MPPGEEERGNDDGDIDHYVDALKYSSGLSDDILIMKKSKGIEVSKVKALQFYGA